MPDDKNTENYTIKSCPTCGAKLRFPADRGRLKVRCPLCQSNYVFEGEDLFLLCDTVANSDFVDDRSNHDPERKPTEKQQKTRRIVLVSAAILLALVVGLVSGLYANRHKHTWLAADCVQPATCATCGDTNGLPIGHIWIDATCTTPKTCKVCGKAEGIALSHSWIDATCTEPKTCSVCNETEGEALGHNWTLEKSTIPSRCFLCGEIRPMSLPESGHVYIGFGLEILSELYDKAMSELTIKTPNHSYYVKLKDTSGEDVFSFFVRANSTTTVNVPAEKCYVYFASGDEWYGTQLYFGEDTVFSKDNELLDFSKQTFTYTLYTVPDGNFKETPITKDEFD